MFAAKKVSERNEDCRFQATHPSTSLYNVRGKISQRSWPRLYIWALSMWD